MPAGNWAAHSRKRATTRYLCGRFFSLFICCSWHDAIFRNAGSASSSGTNSTQSQQAFIFHVQNQPLTHKAAVYYHQQLALQEDQGMRATKLHQLEENHSQHMCSDRVFYFRNYLGIDLTQSPGRDSPGSSSGSAGSGSRHSTGLYAACAATE